MQSHILRKALSVHTVWMLCKLYFVHCVQLNINTCSFWLFPVLYKTGHCERISLQCCTNTEEKATLNKTGPNECLPEGQLCRGYSCRQKVSSFFLLLNPLVNVRSQKLNCFSLVTSTVAILNQACNKKLKVVASLQCCSKTVALLRLHNSP